MFFSTNSQERKPKAQDSEPLESIVSVFKGDNRRETAPQGRGIDSGPLKPNETKTADVAARNGPWVEESWIWAPKL